MGSTDWDQITESLYTTRRTVGQNVLGRYFCRSRYFGAKLVAAGARVVTPVDLNAVDQHLIENYYCVPTHSQISVDARGLVFVVD